MQNEVRFIRKGGRVIPIRVKPNDTKPKKNKKPKKAQKFYDKPSVQFGIFSTAGLGISALGGRLAGRTLRSAEKTSQMSFDYLLEKKGSKLPKGIKSVGEGFQKARKQQNFSIKKRAIFKIGGAAALSLGFTKGFEALGYDKPTLAQEASRETSALLASHLVMKGFEEGFTGAKSKRKFSVKIPDSLKKVAKDLSTRFIKKQMRFKL
jgi:hypothetical protein